MKIPMQEKIAELERRIVALESKQARTVTTTTTTSMAPVDSKHWSRDVGPLRRDVRLDGETLQVTEQGRQG